MKTGKNKGKESPSLNHPKTIKLVIPSAGKKRMRQSFDIKPEYELLFKMSQELGIPFRGFREFMTLLKNPRSTKAIIQKASSVKLLYDEHAQLLELWARHMHSTILSELTEALDSKRERRNDAA